jgi:hypothetical protein
MKLFIETGNAAFDEGNKQYEIGRILEEVAGKIADGGNFDFPLRDVNGNTVGQLALGEFTKEPGPGSFVITFETDNAAFEDNGVAWEAARIFSDAAEKARDGNFSYRVRDINGNVVGEASSIDPEPENKADPEITPLAQAFGNLIQHCHDEGQFFLDDKDAPNGADLAVALDALSEYLVALQPKLEREFKAIRPDVAGKLMEQNATSLDDTELERVFSQTVLPNFNIKHMQRARVAGLTIEDVRALMAPKNEPGM